MPRTANTTAELVPGSITLYCEYGMSDAGAVILKDPEIDQILAFVKPDMKKSLTISAVAFTLIVSTSKASHIAYKPKAMMCCCS